MHVRCYMTYLFDVLVHVASHLFGQLRLSCENNRMNIQTSFNYSISNGTCFRLIIFFFLQYISNAKISGTLENALISDLSFTWCWCKSQCFPLWKSFNHLLLSWSTHSLSVKYSAYKCSYMILMSCIWYAYDVREREQLCVCVCLCLVAVFNIDVSWPVFVAEGNREYEHHLFFIYLSGLSFHHLPFYQPSIYLSVSLFPPL